MTKPLPGFHDVHCFMCGQSCGTVTHYGGDHRLNWCEYCADIPHYCYTCYSQPDIKKFPARKEGMFNRKNPNEPRDGVKGEIVNVREFSQRLREFKVGTEVVVVDGSRNKIVCQVRFIDAPDSLEVIGSKTYTQ